MRIREIKNLLDLLRHPRAAVIVHDLIVVAIAWVGSSWLVERIAGVSLINGANLFTEVLFVATRATGDLE